MRRQIPRLLLQALDLQTATAQSQLTPPFKTSQSLISESRKPLISLLNAYKASFTASSRQLFAKDESKPAAGAANTQKEEDQHDSDAGSDEESIPPDQLKAALDETLQALETERKRHEEMRDKLMRTLADMENLRERTSRQMAEAKQYASADVVKSLLDVADNLERAAGSVAEAEVDGSSEIDLDRAMGLLKSLRDGVVLTDAILMKVLGKHGVTRYDPLGDQFDPNLHAALFQVPDATKDPGTVAVVVKKGYMMHDRPLRAAEVGVTQASDEQ